MQIIPYPEKSAWPALLSRPALAARDLDALVQPVLDAVKLHGDSALLEYTARFDRVNLNAVTVSAAEFEEAEALVDAGLKKAMEVASRNIETFHQAQQLVPRKITTTAGVTCWQKPVPIGRVGLYVPGGSAPLFSTVLMLAIPARIAGCGTRILCTPPMANGKVHPAVLVAARLTGVTSVFKAGGAQAIAAMAYGTESVPAVYKIFGPGNQYVTAAKQLVARDGVAIDMPAGPSEVAVVADETAPPAFVASDLLSQAEHGADSQVILFTTRRETAEAVMAEVERQLEQLPRSAIAAKALQHSRAFICTTMQEVMEMVNAYAPEHLILACDKAETLAEQVEEAGSVFLGHYTPESAGDYASGTNHTLPTNGHARAYNGVNLDSFVKKITFQQVSREGLENLADTITTMAEAEALMAHSRAVSIRIRESHD
jgi:histidinol dehydrogenase